MVQNECIKVNGNKLAKAYMLFKSSSHLQQIKKLVSHQYVPPLPLAHPLTRNVSVQIILWVFHNKSKKGRIPKYL